MQIRRFLCTTIVFVFVQLVNAQGVIRGVVLDADTREPVIGATVADTSRRKPLTVTDSDGRFVIPKNCYPKQLKITYIGYKPKIFDIKADTSELEIRLETEISLLGEVVVTAEESRGLTSASKIEKHAMEHLQPSSFADLLELLPGGTSRDPMLSAVNTIRLREAAPLGSNYATSSLGTSFLVDGARISTNADMQYISGAWESAATSRESVNAGWVAGRANSKVTTQRGTAIKRKKFSTGKYVDTNNLKNDMESRQTPYMKK